MGRKELSVLFLIALDDEPLLQPASFDEIRDGNDDGDDRAAQMEDDRSIVLAVGALLMNGEAMMVYSLNFWSWEG